MLYRVCYFLLGMLCTVGSLTDDPCVKKSSCICESSKGTINLTAIASTDETAKYPDLSSPSTTDWLFSWNPCFPFTEGTTGTTSDDTCTKVAACQVSSSAYNGQYNLGNQDSATFTTGDDGSVTLSYEHKLVAAGSKVTSRAAHVKLVCSKDTPGTVTVPGEKPDGSGQFYLQYTGTYACPVGPAKSGSSGLSIGSILCIVFFVLVIVYLIAGISFQVFYRKSSGIEIIPNVYFWGSVGGRIKDGFKFVFCREKL